MLGIFTSPLKFDEQDPRQCFFDDDSEGKLHVQGVHSRSKGLP